MVKKTKNTIGDSRSLGELRAWRKLLYRRNVFHTRIRPQFNGRILSLAKGGARKGDFIKFVDMYFSKQVSKPPGWGEKRQVTKLTKKSDGYKAFNKFAMTGYGSSVIKEMVYHPREYLKEGFIIMEGVTPGAHGDYASMTLPKKFPKAGGRFSPKGQKIYDLAIVYHEFSHTMVFRSRVSKGKKPTIHDERIAVMKFENPVRMKKGMEPRYTYVLLNSSGGAIKTINIITGKVKSGKWTVSKYDPTILIKPGHKDAL